MLKSNFVFDPDYIFSVEGRGISLISPELQGYYTRIFELTSMKIQPRIPSVLNHLNAYIDVYIFLY